jgi:hypothetical protein
MAGRVDHVEYERPTSVGAGGRGPGHPDRLALDGDAALTLDVHPVEVLRPGMTRVDDPGQLQHPVGQRGFAVVDVRDDAEVADDRRVGAAWVWQRGERLGHVRLSARGNGHGARFAASRHHPTVSGTARLRRKPTARKA